jgi:hypothetical protein
MLKFNMKNFKEFYFEKYVIGLEEIIQLDGLGAIKAKIDSGNGALNVLHGEDLEISGDVVRFTTVNGIRMEKDIQDTIVIHLGAGNKEERPVVLFDLKIGNRKFKDVPFSIGNRSENAHKILVSKSFVQNDLDALIDVSKKHMAKLNIEVDY